MYPIGIGECLHCVIGGSDGTGRWWWYSSCSVVSSSWSLLVWKGLCMPHRTCLLNTLMMVGVLFLWILTMPLTLSVVLHCGLCTWPSCSGFLFSTYRCYSFIVGFQWAWLAVAVLPLIQSPTKRSGMLMTWIVLALFCMSENGWTTSGSSFGYLPEPSKSFMVVSNEWMESAHDIFGDLGIFIFLVIFSWWAISGSVGCLQFIQGT